MGPKKPRSLHSWALKTKERKQILAQRYLGTAVVMLCVRAMTAKAEPTRDFPHGIACVSAVQVICSLYFKDKSTVGGKLVWCVNTYTSARFHHRAKISMGFWKLQKQVFVPSPYQMLPITRVSSLVVQAFPDNKGKPPLASKSCGLE